MLKVQYQMKNNINSRTFKLKIPKSCYTFFIHSVSESTRLLLPDLSIVPSHMEKKFHIVLCKNTTTISAARDLDPLEKVHLKVLIVWLCNPEQWISIVLGYFKAIP